MPLSSSPQKFFQPTVPTVIPAMLITGIAAGALYYTLLCALDATGKCLQIPMTLQWVIVTILWPWVASVRFIGVQNIALASVVGVVLSFVWIFALACVVRWITIKIRARKSV